MYLRTHNLTNLLKFIIVQNNKHIYIFFFTFYLLCHPKTSLNMITSPLVKIKGTEK